jgi:subtilisin family serine protease
MRKLSLFSVLLVLAVWVGLPLSGELFSGPVLVAAKNEPVVSLSLVDYVAANSNLSRVKIWVYFTDKEIFDQSAYVIATQKRMTEFTPRALARKQKVKLSPIDFYDLPVSQNYLKLVEKSGAKLVHPSRWLNAASFYVEPKKIESIAGLPFVKFVDLVKKYKVIPEPIEEANLKLPESRPQTAEAHALNYGPSFDQLNQLDVPALHDKGFNGNGIIIGMFDTGFRKDHPAFASAYAENRVIAEYDFIFNDTNTQNETGQDPSNQHSHGTNTWSISGGESSGNIYGPAYKASFLLAKTEWVPAESLSEEDNWAAAAEWVDSIGGDVISSSLGYSCFDDGFCYGYSNMNGDVAITTQAADMAAVNGIIVVNSMGNSGPGSGTLSAPADADSIIAAGAVDVSGVIAGFSSRGPTWDGRTKPELVARGVSTYLAVASTLSYGSGNGTSYSCPLLAGCAALLWSARPNLTNMQVREAMMGAGNRVSSPDNIYGNGLPDMLKALRYSFVPGDLNGDERITLGDVIFLVNYIFKTGSPEPVPLSAGDTDCDTNITVGDILRMVNYIFKGGPAAC